MQYVIITDLDGTLLDENYEFDAALSALNRLKRTGIPVVACTSKTRAETILWRRRLHLPTPFIVENGGAICIPRDYFSFPFSVHSSNPDFDCLVFGTAYPRLREVLQELREAGIPVRGFGDMAAAEIAAAAGLSLEHAALARQREYDEPFLLEAGAGKKALAIARRIAERHSLRVEKGGRFYHLLGDNDKGRATSSLANLYRQQYGNLALVGIGDSENDFSFLREVDLPFLVQRLDGSYATDKFIQAPGKGPRGWSWAVGNLLPEAQT